MAEKRRHAAHIDYQQQLRKVGAPACKSDSVAKQALCEYKAELGQLQCRDVRRPKAMHTQRRKKVMQIYEHMVHAVEQNREVHVAVVIERQDGSQNDRD